MNAPSRHRRPSSPSGQTDPFAAPLRLPEGLRHHPDLLSTEEEEALARELEQLPFKPFDFQGSLANRRVESFEYRYDYDRRAVLEAAPFPFLEPRRRKMAALFDRSAESSRQLLINEYRPGAGIGWRRDKAQFDEVVGVSLLAPCTLRFRRKADETWDRRLAYGRTALSVSALRAGAHGLGARHPGCRPPTLFDHSRTLVTNPKVAAGYDEARE